MHAGKEPGARLRPPRKPRPAAAGILLVLFALWGWVPACKYKPGRGDAAWNTRVEQSRKQIPTSICRIHYLDLGSGVPVIMVPGFADSTYCWSENVGVLTEAGFRLILVDPPGMGRSEVPPRGYKYSMENQARAVLELADSLGLARFHLIGSSMGGGISLYLSLRNPERVIKTVVLSPACYEPESHHLPIPPRLGDIAAPLFGELVVRILLRQVYFHDQMVDEILVEEYSRPLSKPGYVFALLSLQKHFFSPEFAAMTKDYSQMKPLVLIIWGEQDTWVPPEFGPRLNSQLPGSVLKTIPACGHLPHREKVDEVNRLIVEHLDDRG